MFREDLAVLESYLLISQIRFEELRYTIAVEPALETLRVPKLFLLPLVENAIKYGLRYRHDLVIEISVRRIADAIYFTVADNGPGISQKGRPILKSSCIQRIHIMAWSILIVDSSINLQKLN